MRGAHRPMVSRGFVVAAALAVVATPAGFMAYKLSVASRRSVEERARADQVLDAFPLYDENLAYFTLMLDRAHAGAFDAAYRSGGLAGPAAFDEAAYNRALASGLLALIRSQSDPKAGALADLLEAWFERQPALFN